MFRGSLNTLLPLLSLPFVNLLLSTTAEGSPQLYQQAQRFIEQHAETVSQPGDRIDISISELDSRMQLSTCASPLLFENRRPIAAGAFTLKASCESPRKWSIYLNGRLEIYRQIVVASRPLGRDSELSSDKLTLTEHPLSRLPNGFYTNVEDLSGYITRRNLPAGQPIIPAQLSQPLLVREGDKVVIAASNPLLNVEAAGEALEDGHLNQQIDVRNLRSERVIRARVVGRGRVSPP